MSEVGSDPYGGGKKYSPSDIVRLSGDMSIFDKVFENPLWGKVAYNIVIKSQAQSRWVERSFHDSYEVVEMVGKGFAKDDGGLISLTKEALELLVNKFPCKVDDPEN